MEEGNVSPEECLLIEDSPAGVRAALAAGMEVVAAATPFTRDQLAEMDELLEDRIVEGREELLALAEEVFRQAVADPR